MRPYTVDLASLSDPVVHLSNTSIQKYSSEYKEQKDDQVSNLGEVVSGLGIKIVIFQLNEHVEWIECKAWSNLFVQVLTRQQLADAIEADGDPVSANFIRTSLDGQIKKCIVDIMRVRLFEVHVVERKDVLVGVWVLLF